MPIDAEILKELRNFNRNVEWLKANANKSKRWVKVGAVIEITGWDFRRLDRARKNHEIEFKKEGRKIFYNLDSIPQIHLKQTA
jgi:hypothetical protein